MKTIIYYTVYKNEEGYVGLALANNGLFIDSYDVCKDIKSFPTFEEADNHINETNKPVYFENFGLNYELKYLPFKSLQWESISEKWLNFEPKEEEMVENFLDFLPFFEKIKFKVKVLLTSFRSSKNFPICRS